MVRQALRWTFTLNNPTPEEQAQLTLIGQEMTLVVYLLFSEETGDLGTPHLQGYLELPRKKTLNGVKIALTCLGRAHLEQAKGSAEQNKEYCSKEHEPLEFGQPRRQGVRTDLLSAKQFIDDGCSMEDLMDEHFSVWAKYERTLEKYWNRKNQKSGWSKPQVIVLWGLSGTGKTKRAWEKDPDSTWVYPGLNWFDGYEGQRVAIFDEFDGSDMPFSRWKQVVDGYRVTVRVKGSHVDFRPTTIYFTSNVPPHEWFSDESKPVGWLAQLERRIDEKHHMRIAE